MNLTILDDVLAVQRVRDLTGESRKTSLRFPCDLALVCGFAFTIVVACGTPSAASRLAKEAAQAPSGHNADRLLIVDCELPGQIRQLGSMATYVTSRRTAKLSANECALRGGEYVAYDRADLGTALDAWLPAAEKGDKEAQTYVGEIYERGIGGAVPNYAMAAKWYRKAAEQKFPRAQFNLGFLYEKGLGVPKDPVAALDLYRRGSGLPGIIALDDPSASTSATRVGEARALRRELEKTRKELNKAREELERERGRSQVESQRLTLEREQAEQSGDMAAQRRLSAELKQRQDQLEAKGQRVAQLDESLGSMRKRLREAEGEGAELRTEVLHLRDKLAKSDQEIEAHKATMTDATRKVDTLKEELEQYRQNAANSTGLRERIKSLEKQLVQREREVVRQAGELTRLEQVAQENRVKLSSAESRARVAPSEASRSGVSFAPPTIQLIDPPMIALRATAPGNIRVRGNITARQLVGKVTAPAGLLSFTVNDKNEPIDSNGLFKAQVAMPGTTTGVTLVAVDKMGKRATLDFSLVSERGVATAPAPKKPVIPHMDFGRYYALVIGDQKYQYLPSLDTALEDATAVSDVLSKKYGFQVTPLLNATRYEILSALNKLRSQLTEKDNLLIYYAGHGELDRANARGHWLPVDAEPKSDANWIDSVRISDILNAMTVKHVLVVADSCYSGAMTRSSIGQIEAGLSDEARQRWLEALVQARARTVLTSGGLEPVIDGGGGKHSVFAKAFLEVLWQNEAPLEGQRLYREVAARVLERASHFKIHQQPEYAPLKYAGHEAGDFIFVPNEL